jgi:hypothetical protein
MQERAGSVLSLCRSVVGDTPVFELRRADHLIRYNKFEEAVEILEHLLTDREPFSSSALTLLFRATADLESEESALAVVTRYFDIASPAVFINAARSCRNSDVAWAIYQMGVDKFPSDDGVVMAAAGFLEQHRDIRNARLLFQQSLTEDGKRFNIRRSLFQFELDHIAPLDHLNETQKVFRKSSADPLLLYMQRYRFMDLYPLDPDELQLIGHLSRYGSIDLTDEPNHREPLTTIPPYGMDGRALQRRLPWMDIVEQNIRRANGQDQREGGQNAAKRIPPAIHVMLKGIQDQKLYFAPPNVDEVIAALERFKIRDSRAGLGLDFPRVH